MAEVTAAMVKDLRERTGAGMMDCKNALVEAGGDVGKATEIIQKKGLAKAVKAAGRIAADGAIVAAVAPDATGGVLVEINCQTDFVARGDEFQGFAKRVAKEALASNVSDVDALAERGVDGKTLREHADALTAKSGEKHALRRMERLEAKKGHGVVTSYIHHGGRLGVVVRVEAEKAADDALKAFADEMALQIASMGPKFVRKDDAPAEMVDKQREIFVAQMKNEDAEAIKALDDFQRDVAALGHEPSDRDNETLKGFEKKANAVKSRPEAARVKILDGKVNKWLSEMALLEQTSVKDSNKTIGQMVRDLAKSHGKVEIVKFVRYELGEGLDRGPSKDFATEVAEMAASAQKH